MARLILIRHGQSVANAEGRFTRGPFEPLTDRGRLEARRTAERLLSRYAPAAIYSSPFERARQTAAEIARLAELPVRLVDALREQSFGVLHGQPYEAFRREAASGGLDRFRLRPPGGETLLEVAERAGPALDRIAGCHAGEDVVVVSHGGVMAALRGFARGDFRTPPEPTPNAEGFVLERGPHGYRGPFPLFDD